MGAGGLKPPPRNSMESRGKKEGEEGERKEGGRRKGGWRKKKGDEPPKRQILDPPLAPMEVISRLNRGTAYGRPIG